MENLNKQIDKLNCILHGNGSTYSVYPYDKYSIQEVICEVVTKINEVIDVVEEYTAMVKSLLEWIQDEGITTEVKSYLDEMLLDGRLADIINVELFDELNCKINDLYDNKLYISVKEYGAKGDGLTNDTNSIQECINYCFKQGKTVYIPKGEYIFDTSFYCLKSYDSVLSKKPIVIIGEGKGLVKINYISPNITEKPSIFNLIHNDTIQIENIETNTTNPIDFIDPTLYAKDQKLWIKAHTSKNISLKNVLYTGDGGHTSYYNYINSPKPKNYERYSDGNYAKYPFEITNCGGYNAININNFTMNDDLTIGNPSDNSAIGIVDYTTNSTGVIFVDMFGDRAFQRFVKRDAEISSQIRQSTVYEVAPNGHVAIGCSYVSNDPVAKGWETIKIRDNSPTIGFYDANSDNKKFAIGLVKQSWGNVFELKFGNTGLSMWEEEPGWVSYNGFNTGGINGGLKVNVESDGVDNLYKGIIINDKTNNQRVSIATDGNNDLRLYRTLNTTGRAQGNRILINLNGESYERPKLFSDWYDRGTMFFDRDLGKPIWWTGSKWVDATGATV